jgi:carboxypeptidase C (cathepsin A)
MKFNIVILAVLIAATQAAIPADLVNTTAIPGFPANLTFSIYSGILPLVDGSGIHYVLMTQWNTTNTTNSYPLVMWMNGGPGCSSLLGAFQEVGPIVQDDGAYGFNGSLNPWSWTQAANFLYFESPVGVGFSPAGTVPASNYTDPQTAQNQYDALLLFFASYPELLTNQFWIAGESYAGVYVPTLAALIDTNNPNATTKLNLKGIIVGNGVNNRNTLTDSTIQFQYGHHLISPYVYEMYSTACTNDPNSAGCTFALNMINNYTTIVNPYDIYRYCYYANYSNTSNGTENTRRNRYRYPRTPWFMGEQLGDDSNSPCTWDIGLTDFFNLPEVQTAFNVAALNVTWDECNDDIFAVYNSTGSFDAYIQLLNSTANYSITVYSGDTDSVVPFVDTEAWINNVNLPVVEEWRPWWVDGVYGPQVAGYVQRYQGLQFVTVKGVGHMVPQWKRQEALTVFLSVATGTELPGNPFTDTSLFTS